MRNVAIPYSILFTQRRHVFRNLLELLSCEECRGRNRRKCGVVKGARQPGVQSECAGITCFRRLVQEDSCFEHEKLRHVIERVWKCSSMWRDHICHQECVRRHRSWTTTKNNKLSMSAFLPSSLWGHERHGQTSLHCVFGPLFLCAPTLTCITTGLHLHVSVVQRSWKFLQSTTHNISVRRPEPASCLFFPWIQHLTVLVLSFRSLNLLCSQ